MKIYLSAVLLILAGCSTAAPPSSEGPPPIPVTTVGVEIRNVPLFFESMGVVKPAQTAEVKPQVAGMITEVHVMEGQHVEKGDILYVIEETSYAIKAKEMEAILSQNQAHLSNVQKKLSRYQSLSNPDLIAKVEWDAIETQVALYEAMVAADDAKLKFAKLDLEHCHVAAPISGRVGKLSLQEGNLAAEICLISQIEPLTVDFLITETELKKLGDKSFIEIYGAGSEERLAEGAVSFLDHHIDTKSGMVAARGVLSKLLRPVLPGQSVRVKIFFGEKSQAKLIPLKAIKTNQNGPYIFYVKDDNTVEMRSVKLGPVEKDLVVIEEGVEAADRIIAEGHLRLFPSSKIKEADG